MVSFASSGSSEALVCDSHAFPPHPFFIELMHLSRRHRQYSPLLALSMETEDDEL